MSRLIRAAFTLVSYVLGCAGAKVAPATPTPCHDGDELTCAAACKSGQAGACYSLGALHMARGGAADLEKAVAEFGQACDGGNAAGCRYFGLLVEKSERYAEAAQRYTKACDGNDTEACGFLGNLYAHGRGVPQESTVAAELYRRACDGGMAEACTDLGSIYQLGDGLPVDLPAALVLYGKGCDRGLPGACVDLGVMLERGQGTAQDFARAVQLYQSACTDKVVEGCAYLAAMVLNGRGAPEDAERAVALLNRSCTDQDSGGCWLLGTLCLKGTGVPRDRARAASLFKRSCDGGESRSCRVLGRLLRDGIDVPRDPAQGIALVTKACVQREPEACRELGLAYALGADVRPDRDHAVALLKQACEAGVADACIEEKEVAGTKPRPVAMPAQFGGFVFGSARADAESACVRAGKRVSADPSDPDRFTCSGVAAGVGFEVVRTSLLLCGGKVCEVGVVRGRPARMTHAAWLRSRAPILKRLIRRYGAESRVDFTTLESVWDLEDEDRSLGGRIALRIGDDEMPLLFQSKEALLRQSVANADSSQF